MLFWIKISSFAKDIKDSMFKFANILQPRCMVEKMSWRIGENPRGLGRAFDS